MRRGELLFSVKVNGLFYYLSKLSCLVCVIKLRDFGKGRGGGGMLVQRTESLQPTVPLDGGLCYFKNLHE